jgi:predicted amidohydrolase
MMESSKKTDTLNITLVQFNSSRDKEENLEVILSKIEEYSKKSDIIIFPEYSMIKPDFNDREFLINNAESIDNNFITKIREKAKSQKVSVICNFVEKKGGNEKPYNTSIVIDSMGLICGKYQKLHLFDSYDYRESAIYNKGLLRPETLDLRGLKFGLQICYDIRFPELTRLYSLTGASIVFVQAGFFKGENKVETWQSLLKSMAISNGVFVVATGQGEPEFIGHSIIINPEGTTLAEAKEGTEDVSGSINIAEVSKYRDMVPVLEGRRRDFYDVSGL